MGKTSWNGVLGRAWVTRWPLSAIKQPSSEDPLFLQPLEGVIHPTIGIRALLTDPKSVATGFVDVERYVHAGVDRKSTRLNQSLMRISYAVFCLQKKKNK